MKKSILAIFLLAVILIATSCASQKYGCPNNPQYSTARFRG